MDCIVTLGWGGVAWAQPGGLSHDTAEPAPRYDQHGLRHGRPARKGERHSREGLAVGRLGSDTNGSIVTDAWPLGCVIIRVRHGWGKRHDTAQEAAICASVQ